MRADLLLNVAAEFLGGCDHEEGFGSASRTANAAGALTEQASPEGLVDTNTFHAREHHVQGTAASHPGLNQHAPVRYRHFRGVALCKAVSKDGDCSHDQQDPAEFGRVKTGG